MELSKSQIDEFSAHIQHEFWSIIEGRKYFLLRRPNPRPIAEAPFTLRAIQNRTIYCVPILLVMVMIPRPKHLAQKKVGRSTYWKIAQSSIIIHGEELAVGTNASQVIYSSPRNVDPSTGKFAHSGISLQLAIGTSSYLAGWDRTAVAIGTVFYSHAEQSKAAKPCFRT